MATVEQPGSARARAVTYGALPLLSLAAVQAVQNGEMASLSFAFDGLKADFGTTDTALGALPFAMAVVGLGGAVPFGVLADKSRRTVLLAVAMAVWTLAMGVTAAAASFAFVFLARMFVGAIEANSPAAISLLSDFYPVRRRASIMGRYQLGSFAGVLIANLGVGFAVQAGGWRWAFLTWVPFGVTVVLLLLRCREPTRGMQDADYGDDMRAVAQTTAGAVELAAGLDAAADLERVREHVPLPPPGRVGTLDYGALGGRAVLRELLRIRSMWFGLLAITVSQLLLNGLATWQIPYFMRVHHLSAPEAGGISSLLALGAAGGILCGGILSDRYMRRGHLNGRVRVIAVGSVVATAVLMPAFASTDLGVTAPLFLVGGFFVTLPIAPSEAMLADVVVCELRGRASTVRSIVRTLSAAGPLVIGVLIDLMGIRLALTLFMPIYGIGGLLVLLATRSYPRDVSFVVAEAARTLVGQGGPGACGA